MRGLLTDPDGRVVAVLPAGLPPAVIRIAGEALVHHPHQGVAAQTRALLLGEFDVPVGSTTKSPSICSTRHRSSHP